MEMINANELVYAYDEQDGARLSGRYFPHR